MSCGTSGPDRARDGAARSLFGRAAPPGRTAAAGWHSPRTQSGRGLPERSRARLRWVKPVARALARGRCDELASASPRADAGLVHSGAWRASRGPACRNALLAGLDLGPRLGA